MIPSPDNANRLALGLMASRSLYYDEAVEVLENLTLLLVCDSAIRSSASLQAAVITAANCGYRAYLGGVRVELPEDVPILVRWPGQTTLNAVLTEILGQDVDFSAPATHTVYFGFTPSDPAPDSLRVNASGWRGGVEPTTEKSKFEVSPTEDFALGGIFAGAMAVYRGFLRATGLSYFACDTAVGVSLWNPEADWFSAQAEGPGLRALPQSLWILGLGHLGQAFLWTLSMLPYENPSDCELMLQDFDVIEEANIGSGLLCKGHDIGRTKTRVASDWIEARGFRTKITERKFDETTKRSSSEPGIALCGFDKAEPRRILEGADFLRVFECGLGGTITDFDLIHIHNFPGIHSASSLWEEHAVPESRPHSKVAQALAGADEVCGALAIETAGKSVSTSFVGAMASATLFGEILRAFNRGQRHDEIFLSPRNMEDTDFVKSGDSYKPSDIARTGYVEAIQHPS